MIQLDGLQLTNEQLQIVATCTPPPGQQQQQQQGHDNNTKKKNSNDDASNKKLLTSNGSTKGRITNYYDSSSSCTTKPSCSSGGGGKLIRITAAAGAGKTTTLLAIALRAIELGHTHISYVTFTNAAANDGKIRLEKALQQHTAKNPRNPLTIEARTLHSFAVRLLQQQYNNIDTSSNDDSFYDNKLWTDQKIQKWIANECADAIETFLRPCYSEIEHKFGSQNNSNHYRHRTSDNKVQETKDRALKQVQFFIFKSLKHFCHNSWTLETYSGCSSNDDNDSYNDDEYGSYNYRYKQQRNATIPFGRDYYPIKLFHEPRKTKGGSKLCGEDIGFNPYIYKNKIGWYAEQVVGLWKLILHNRIRNFDFDMKRVQLEKLIIPGTILLVDESQDMDSCQVDWAIQQQVGATTTRMMTGQLSKIVYVVGDPAQSIYGFRGAKPQYLMELQSHIDLKLTDSWRFGLSISHIANLILYSKEKSDQTSTKKRCSWNPYRVRPGIINKESIVTTIPLINQWKNMKVTVIASTNVHLLVQALGLLGFSLDNNNTGEDGDEMDDDNDDYGLVEFETPIPKKSDSKSSPADDDDDDTAGYDSDDYVELEDEEGPSDRNDGNNNFPLDFPKIHINGKGENSGAKLWKKTIQLITDVFRLYKLTLEENSFPIALDKKLFPDFVGRTVTWKEFVDECELKELSRYQNAIYVVQSCKLKTPEAINYFKQYVLDKKFTPDEANIILTTCHSAKGMEWDNVHVCNDFIELCRFKKQDPTNDFVNYNNKYSRYMKHEQSVANSPVWKFDFDEWGDSLNVLYVACTRAKCRLYIPECVFKVLLTMDLIHQHVHRNNNNQQHNIITPDVAKSDGNITTMTIKPDVAVSSSSSSTPKVNMVAFQIPGYKKPLSPPDVTAFYKCLVEPLRKEYKVPSTNHTLLHVLQIDKDSSMNVTNDSYMDDFERDRQIDEGNNYFGSSQTKKKEYSSKRKQKPSTKPKSSFSTKKSSKYY